MTTMPSAPTLRTVALALLLVSGCSNMSKPGPQSVAGMSSDGTVTMTEIMAVGAEGGKGSELSGAFVSIQAGRRGDRRRRRGQHAGHWRGLQLAQHFRFQRAVYAEQRRPGLCRVGRQRSVAAQRGRSGAASEGDAGGCVAKPGSRGNPDRDALTNAAAWATNAARSSKTDIWRLRFMAKGYSRSHHTRNVRSPPQQRSERLPPHLSERLHSK
jgi:hypothetical protein